VDRARTVAVTRRRGRAAGESTAAEIRSVALDLFYKHGFQATTLRHIASRVGIQVGSLYNHITSKGELLFDIMETVMQSLLEDQRQVAQEADVVERMRLLVYHHVRFHGERAKEVFIGNSELRSLNRTQRARIVALRHEYEEMFQKELEDGIRQGKFQRVDVQVTAFGIIAMTTWVSAWYSARGRLSLEEIADIYSDMVLRGIWNPAAGQLQTHLRRVGRDNAKRMVAAAGASK
jgi:TetR/AcrR family transcriptional regulator, cholesterol catabolism regulator